MKKKRFTEEHIVRSLRAAETGTSAGPARHPGVSEQSIDRWKRQCGPLKEPAVRERRQLRHEHGRVKKVFAERDLEVEIRQEIQANKWEAHGPGGRPPAMPVSVGFVRDGPRGCAPPRAPGSSLPLSWCAGMPGSPRRCAGWPRDARSGATGERAAFLATGAGRSSSRAFIACGNSTGCRCRDARVARKW